MSDPTFGISITRIDNEPRPAVWSDMAVVGIIGTAPLADAAMYPADTPVFLYSDDETKLTGLGEAGTLLSALRLINAQLGEFQVAAKAIIEGRLGKVEPDAFQRGELMGHEYAINEVMHYELWFNETEKLFWDFYSSECRLDGISQNDDERRLLRLPTGA